MIICYLTIVDEHSGSALATLVFNYARINQVPLTEFRMRLLKVFQQWGKPGAFRVDNGEPLGNPKNTNTPTSFSMWLIAHGVKMIWNAPKCPQQNGKVERMQGTSMRWAEIKSCSTIKEVQAKLDWAIQIQTFKYPVVRLGGKTRIEAFPCLNTKQRNWNILDVDASRVWKFLAKKKFVRKVSSNAQISHFGMKYSIGSKYKKQYVNLIFNADTQKWSVYDAKGDIIKTLTAHNLSLRRILSFSVFSKN